jgi:hypothetical protein
MFTSCLNHGFQIEFSNGYTVSCQFGKMHYCSRLSPFFSFDEDLKEDRICSEDCEIAVISPEKSGLRMRNRFVTGKILKDMNLELDSDEMVASYVSADDVAKIIAYVQRLEGEV